MRAPGQAWSLDMASMSAQTLPWSAKDPVCAGPAPCPAGLPLATGFLGPSCSLCREAPGLSYVQRLLLELPWVAQCDLTHGRHPLSPSCAASLGPVPSQLGSRAFWVFPDLPAGCWPQGQAGTEGAKGACETYSFRSLPHSLTHAQALFSSWCPHLTSGYAPGPSWVLAPRRRSPSGPVGRFSLMRTRDQLWTTFLRAWSSEGGIACWALVLPPVPPKGWVVCTSLCALGSI